MFRFLLALALAVVPSLARAQTPVDPATALSNIESVIRGSGPPIQGKTKVNNNSLADILEQSIGAAQYLHNQVLTHTQLDSAPVGGMGLASKIHSQALAAGATAAIRTVDDKFNEPCVGIYDLTPATSTTVGADNAIRLKAAYLEAGQSGRGCVRVFNPAANGPIIIDPVTFSEYNNISIICDAAGTVRAGGSVHFQPSSLTSTAITISGVSGVNIRGCGFTSASQQTAGSYVRVVGANSILLENISMDHGFDPLYMYNAVLTYVINPNIRNNAHIAVTMTGDANSQGGTHDVYFLNPSIDNDCDSASTDPACPGLHPTAGFYIDQSGGSIITVGGDILHQHNNYWLNPGAGQFAIWEYTIGTDLDSADWPDDLNGGTSLAITPHNGGISSGNYFTSFWASTGSPAIKLVGDATSTCEGNSLVQFQSINAWTQSILTDYCKDTIIGFPHIAMASAANHGVNAAVQIEPHTGSIQIIGGVIGSQGANLPVKQKFNLQLDPGFSGRFVMVGTDISGGGVFDNTCGTGSTQCMVAPVYYDLSSGSPAIGSGVTSSPGFNPQGPVAVAGVTTGTWTYRAGYTTEQVSFVGGTCSGITIPTSAGTPITMATSTNVSLVLAPSQTLTAACTAAPTVVAARQ